MTDQQGQPLNQVQALQILHQAARLAALPFKETVVVEQAAEILGKYIETFKGSEIPPVPEDLVEPTKPPTKRGRRRKADTPDPEEVDI